MFNENLLRELATIEGSGPILSVYLNLDPTEHTLEESKLILQEMLREVESEVEEADLKAIEQYVALEFDGTGQSLVFFSRQADELWQVIPLSVPVRSGVTVARKPYISPLVEIEGLYGRFAVALVDQQGARFTLFQLGDLVTQEGFLGAEIRGARKDKGSSRVGMHGGGSKNKRAEIVQRNYRDMASELTKFCQKHKARQLLLAGTDANVARFQGLLPPVLANGIVGTFAADMETSITQLRESALHLLDAMGRQRKEALVDTVITVAAKGANGVIRLGETLSAAHQGRIQVLVVGRDYHAPGYRCSGCGYLTAQQLTTCPFCKAEFEEIADAAEAVVAQVVEKGGTVQVVDDKIIGEAKIGALLRY